MTPHRSDRVLGVDLSLTATGLATVDEAYTVTIRGDTELDRLRRIVGTVAGLARPMDLVVLEGLSFNSHTGKQAERSALHWMVRDRLDLDGVPVAICPPTVRARYATGRGNAGKDQVMIACVQRLPILVSNNNEADAAWLLALGLDHLGVPLAQLPAAHRTALGGVDWPVVPTAVAS
jgi:crossover junction endodeoxyribonuclease RuvC